MGRRNGEKGKRTRILKQPTKEEIEEEEEFLRQLQYLDDKYSNCEEKTDEIIEAFRNEPDSRAKQCVIEDFPIFAVNPEN